MNEEVEEQRPWTITIQIFIMRRNCMRICSFICYKLKASQRETVRWNFANWPWKWYSRICFHLIVVFNFIVLWSTRTCDLWFFFFFIIGFSLAGMYGDWEVIDDEKLFSFFFGWSLIEKLNQNQKKNCFLIVQGTCIFHYYI